MVYQRKDGFYRKAKAEGYRSRAAYKLLELDGKCRLFQRGMRVADLGCSPGGWLQVAADAVGRRGRVAGIDRLATEPLARAQIVILQGDITGDGEVDRLRAALGAPADLVLSDMAPDTTGVGFADHAHSAELVRTAAAVARKLLRPGGALVAKVFEGPDVKTLVDELRSGFNKVRRVHLASTRKGSRELYLVATGFKGARKDGSHGGEQGS
jgi:23S rRNA (uridine2552-2'-O)-methyltransferase